MDRTVDDLRLLGIDDLLLMKMLSENLTLTAAAARLSLTQPAASQRMRKIERVFDAKLFERVGRGLVLTPEGRALCQRAVAAISVLAEGTSLAAHTVINIGTRAEVGRSWLWPAVVKLRKADPNIVFHIHFGSGDEIIRMLGTGQLDAVLTSAPVTLREFGAIEVAREDYCIVAASAIAKQIRTFADLSGQTLLEHDRSFPFQRYVPASTRAKMRFADVWFLASSELMVQAVAAGMGVAIAPKYLCEPLLRSGKIRELKLRLTLDHDWFRIVYSRQRDIAEPIERLASAMRGIGLK